MKQAIEPSFIGANPGYLFALILALEAILSFVDLSRIPGMLSLTEVVGNALPVAANFMSDTAAKSNIAPYVALTCLLMPVKIFAAYFIILRLSPQDKVLVVCFPSSDATLARKLVSSALLLLLVAGMTWYVFFSYGDSSYFSYHDLPRGAVAKYRLVNASGIEMWLGWSVMHLTVMSFLIGLQLVFAVEWFHSLSNLK